jgi:predicted GNAT family N-acyltransferase
MAARRLYQAPAGSFSLRRARTTAELDALFRERHDAYAQRYMPPRADGRVMDRFDAYPTTIHLVAVSGGEIVGGLRMCPRHEVGTPSDHMFDFADHLPASIRRAVSVGMFWVRDDLRGSGLGHALLGYTFHIAAADKRTHVYAGINPEIERFLTRLGFRPTGEPRECDGLQTLPVVLALTDLVHPCTEGMRKGVLEPARLRAERVLLAPGQAMTVAHGDVVLASGTARVTLVGEAPRCVRGFTTFAPGATRSARFEAHTEVELILASTTRRTSRQHLRVAA